MLGAIPPDIWAGQWWRLITALFLFQDFYELLLAGVILCLAGRWLEEALGGVRLLVVFVVAGVGGQLMGLVSDSWPFVGGPMGTCGIVGGALVALAAPQAERDIFHRLAVASAILGLLLFGSSGNPYAVAAALACGAVLVFCMGRRSQPEGLVQAVLLVACGLAFAGGAARALQPDPVRSAAFYHQLGEQAWRHGQRDVARAFWERAVILDGDNGEVHGSLSHAYRKLGLSSMAEAEEQTAIALSPAAPHVLGRLIEQAAARGQSARKASALRIFAREQPSDREASLELARSLGEQQSREAATALYEALAQKNPTDHEILYAAATWFDDVDVARGQRLWGTLARQPARDAADANLIAQAQIKIGESKAAEATVTHYLPGDASADAAPSPPRDVEEVELRLTRANARAEQGHFHEAMFDAEAAALMPHPPWVVAYLRARFYFWWQRDAAQGRTPDAPRAAWVAAAWDDALSAAVSDRERRLATGYRALQVDKNSAQAEASARAILATSPQDGEALYLLGLALEVQGRGAESFDALRKAAAREPGDREFNEALR